MDTKNYNTKPRKLMEWFKRKPIVNKGKHNKIKKCLNNIGDKHEQNPSIPTSKPQFQRIKPIALKQANSLDEKYNPTKLNQNILSSEREEKRGNRCYSEMSNYDLEETYRKWMSLNEHKCDPIEMAKEASNPCHNNHECGPCLRVNFILKHCQKFVHLEHNKTKVLTMSDCTDSSLSTFMDGLPGYSHIQLSKDFRHLQVYHDSGKIRKIQSSVNEQVDYSDTKSLLTYIFHNRSMYGLNMNKHNKKQKLKKQKIDKDRDKRSAEYDKNHQKQGQRLKQPQQTHCDNVLNAVSKLMMECQTQKDFNSKYMKLGIIARGANGKVYKIKSWKQQNKFFAMKEISFKNLSIHILYQLLRNWKMVLDLKLVGENTEIFIDSNKRTLLIVSKLFHGSMCELLRLIYLRQHRYLSENELKQFLRNGVLQTLRTMHLSGYIHGDIKPENLVYESIKKPGKSVSISSAIIDYDLCTNINDNDNESDNNGIFCEWRGTLGYSAPEWSPYRRVKSYVTPKVDIYSLGLSMLLLLCGEQPFLCPTVTREKLQREKPRLDIKQFVYETMLHRGEFMISQFLLNKLPSSISHDLYDLLRQMLTFDVEQRLDIDQVINHKWLNY